MHGVDDVEAFERQLTRLLGWFIPVGVAHVVEWFHGERDLPGPAMWLTFDDGERSTLVDAAPVLQRHGVPATAFVCPGLVEDAVDPWWEVVHRADRAGLSIQVDGTRLQGQKAVTALKRVPDAERRHIVDRLADRVGAGSAAPVTLADLGRWRDMGGDIGNHTWDHPCLDRCAASVQADQIDRATQWLDEHSLWDHRVFAYPNGDRTDDAERHLAEQGFEVVALFDHHLTSTRAGPLRTSRLRLDAGAGPERTAAVTSGLHSGLFSVRERLRPAGRPGSGVAP